MNKKILFISHQLTRTGAPLVLLNMIQCFQDFGDLIYVISLSDGELRPALEQLGIPVTIMPHPSAAADQFVGIFQKFDLVIVNTLDAHEAIPICIQAGVPTLWWIHEHAGYFDYYRDILPTPAELTDNIHVFGVSPLTHKLVIEKAGYTDAGLLPFGVPDYSTRFDFHHRKPDTPVRFLCIGLYAFVKGQDLLCDAIRMLPEGLRNKCQFDFYGDLSDIDPKIHSALEIAMQDFSNIQVHDSLPHENLMQIISDVDYVIIPSRAEPMSAVAIEGMILGVPSIISDVCGVAYWMQNEENALIFPCSDSKALSSQIQKAVLLANSSEYEKLSASARTIYDEYFSMEAFAESIRRIM